MQEKGIEDFRARIVETASFLRDRVGELRDWNDVKLLGLIRACLAGRLLKRQERITLLRAMARRSLFAPAAAIG